MSESGVICHGCIREQDTTEDEYPCKSCMCRECPKRDDCPGSDPVSCIKDENGVMKP